VLNAVRVILIDDQPRESHLIRRTLENDGHTVEVVESPPAAARRLGQDPQPDLVVLDLKLAGSDSLAALAMLRSEIPVLVVSAQDRVADKVAALDLGAADYLVKPFDFGELLARARALSRRRYRRHGTRAP
jgi:DNA-binding response OmpR family regulator